MLVAEVYGPDPNKVNSVVLALEGLSAETLVLGGHRDILLKLMRSATRRLFNCSCAV